MGRDPLCFCFFKCNKIIGRGKTGRGVIWVINAALGQKNAYWLLGFEKEILEVTLVHLGVKLEVPPN